MAVESPTLKAGEFDKWITPREALTRLQSHIVLTAAAQSTIIGRLRPGLIRVAARRAFWRSGRDDIHREFLLVPPDWAAQPEVFQHQNNVWNTGDTEVRLPGGRDSNRIIHLYGVRFDPAGIAEIASPTPTHSTRSGDVQRIDHAILSRYVAPDEPGAPLPLSTPAVLDSGPSPVTPPDGRKLVPEPWLAEWYAAYTVRLPGTFDTEDNAWASAKAFFPGHAVARDRIRSLRKGTKTGRKPREEL